MQKPLISRGEDGEYDDTRNLNNKQVLAKGKDMLQDQDKDLDEIIWVAGAIKEENKNFKVEVKL
jgi:hypothetical protein